LNKTAGILRQLFERLHQEQQKTWFPRDPELRKRKPSARAEEALNILFNSMLPRVEPPDFEHWFPTSADELHVDFMERGKVLYLPPLEKNAEFVPCVDVKCDLDDSKTGMELRVLLVGWIEDPPGSNDTRLRGICFRMESPYADEGENIGGSDEQKIGRHDFYHAQLLKRSRWGSAIEFPDWLPCHQPSFPLTAKCPITLMLCLFLTLYGKKYSWEFFAEKQELFRLLWPYIEALDPWIGWGKLRKT
jgi:hypothetical protein